MLVIQIFSSSVMTFGLPDRAESFIAILKACGNIFIYKAGYCVIVNADGLCNLCVGHSVCAVKDNLCTLYLAVFFGLGTGNLL
mgnify:FL=1